MLGLRFVAEDGDVTTNQGLTVNLADVFELRMVN